MSRSNVRYSIWITAYMRTTRLIALINKCTETKNSKQKFICKIVFYKKEEESISLHHVVIRNVLYIAKSYRYRTLCSMKTVDCWYFVQGYVFLNVNAVTNLLT